MAEIIDEDGNQNVPRKPFDPTQEIGNNNFPEPPEPPEYKPPVKVPSALEGVYGAIDLETAPLYDELAEVYREGVEKLIAIRTARGEEVDQEILNSYYGVSSSFLTSLNWMDQRSHSHPEDKAGSSSPAESTVADTDTSISIPTTKSAIKPDIEPSSSIALDNEHKETPIIETKKRLRQKSEAIKSGEKSKRLIRKEAVPVATKVSVQPSAPLIEVGDKTTDTNLVDTGSAADKEATVTIKTTDVSPKPIVANTQPIEIPLKLELQKVEEKVVIAPQMTDDDKKFLFSVVNISVKSGAGSSYGERLEIIKAVSLQPKLKDKAFQDGQQALNIYLDANPSIMDGDLSKLKEVLGNKFGGYVKLVTSGDPLFLYEAIKKSPNLNTLSAIVKYGSYSNIFGKKNEELATLLENVSEATLDFIPETNGLRTAARRILDSKK